MQNPIYAVVSLVILSAIQFRPLTLALQIEILAKTRIKATKNHIFPQQTEKEQRMTNEPLETIPPEIINETKGGILPFEGDEPPPEDLPKVFFTDKRERQPASSKLWDISHKQTGMGQRHAIITFLKSTCG